ncbi:tetratricopeptide repeat protein [Nocardia amamiensis]|uniref:tetratricopeptide repeat protein n=1 Tax=Nocardia amamiensis TaxID=404578 RepID=UPI00082C1E7C|nr:hypothetical protein [Nocardia amamiensis]
MNDPYSSWAARNSSENLPLAARYQSADPIRWHGSMVYPMYSEQIGPAPTTVTVTMLSAAPPAGLRGLGIGLSVVDGYVDLHGRSLAGVDAWSDALAEGVGFHVTPTAPSTLVTLTPVWVDEFGTQKSWTGNYGIVVEHRPEGRVVLWCSIGEGPANFANLVVEVSTAPTIIAPDVPATNAPETTPMAVSTPIAPPASTEGPPTAPTMPVPRIDAAAPAGESAAIAGPAAEDPAQVGNGRPPANGQSAPARRSGSLFTNLQSSRTALPDPEAPRSAPGSMGGDAQAPADPPHLDHRGPVSNAQTPAEAPVAAARPLLTNPRSGADSPHSAPNTQITADASAPMFAPTPSSAKVPRLPPVDAPSPSAAHPATDIPRTLSSSQVSNMTQHSADASDPPFGPPVANTHPAPYPWDSAPSPQAPNTQPAGALERSLGPLATTTMRSAANTTHPAPGSPSQHTQPPVGTLSSAPIPPVPDTATDPPSPPQAGGRPAAVDPPRPTAETRQSSDPGYRGALYDLGVAMSTMGEEEQACGLWAQAAEAGHAGAAYELGMVRYRHGDPAGAESWWRTAADRGEPRAIAGLADLLDQQGKHTEASSIRRSHGP